MRWCLLTLFLFLLLFPLPAQILGPVAKPVDPIQDPANYGKWLKLEVAGGLNLVARRSILTRFTTRAGVSTLPGLQLRINAVFSPESRTNFVLGAGFVWDRGTITGYQKTVEVTNFAPNAVVTNTPTRERLGEVSINERWFRGHAGVRFMIGKSLQGLVGFQVSGLLSGTQIYTYTQTTTAFFEPVTQRIVLLDQPLVSTGSREFIGGVQGSYGGALFGLSYPVTERLRSSVAFDHGWHFLNGADGPEWRQRRSRLEIGLTYHLVSLTRK